MSQEIVDAVRVLGREKGISEEKLMLALEDALLSAYKKQPGAARYARVRMERETRATSASTSCCCRRTSRSSCSTRPRRPRRSRSAASTRRRAR